MRLRQVVIAARDLDATVDDLTTVFAVDVAYRDPGVAAFGLHNAVMPIGDTFLEVVSPIDPAAPAQRFLERRGGDGGYMVIVQSSDLDADVRRLADLGVRIVWQVALDDIRTVHLHPADVGAAIVSIDEARPAASWRWAGPTWEQRIRRDRVRGVVGAELTAPDPAALAARWGAVLGRPVDVTTIALDGGAIRVVEGPAPGIRSYTLSATDGAAAVAAARARGLATGDDWIDVAGTRFVLATS